MATLVRMPEISASATHGAVTTWTKKQGDVVAIGDCLAEIESDKAVVELNAESAGVMGRLLVEIGQQVEVGTPIASILVPGETRDAVSVPAARAPDPAPPATARVAVTQVERVFASPLARRLAAERGLDLTTTRGSGPGGRIVKRDLDTAAAASPTPPHPAAARPRAQGAAEWVEVPHSSMRKAIARRLSESKATIPHFYVRTDCRMERLIALRAELNASAPRRISLNDFFVRALALALKEAPDANVGWTDLAMRRYAQVDVAVAVATRGGLMTPIVRRADAKSLTSISAEVADLAGRAARGLLKPEEYEGGCVTVSNLGMHGVAEFSAIINPPQAAILAVGKVEPRPVAEDGAVVLGQVLTVVLSVDHRAIDGVVAAQMLNAFKHRLENPAMLQI